MQCLVVNTNGFLTTLDRDVRKRLNHIDQPSGGFPVERQDVFDRGLLTARRDALYLDLSDLSSCSDDLNLDLLPPRRRCVHYLLRPFRSA